MESVLERMKRDGTAEKIESFIKKQKYPYEVKVKYAEKKCYEFIEGCKERGLNCHVSVGGLDSITLLCFLRSLGINIPATSCSYLEDASIQKIHRELGVIALSPAKRPDGTKWSKVKILQEFGFPILSKEIAAKIDLLEHPSEKNKTVRHAIITGETGEYGGWQKNSRMKLPQKWLNLFAGYENENEGTNYQIAPFLISSKCCYYLKEKPSDDWAKKHNSAPFVGLMASEGGRREKALKMHGCNYFGKTTVRSAPFAIFNRQDILQLALDLKAPVPEIYGSIERKDTGELYTTLAQRTGCSMCGFGIHLETRPHRFDLLRDRNPKEWEFWMYRCCRDKSTGEVFGWGRALDYIGVKWEDVPPQQMSMFDGA